MKIRNKKSIVNNKLLLYILSVLTKFVLMFLVLSDWLAYMFINSDVPPVISSGEITDICIILAITFIVFLLDIKLSTDFTAGISMLIVAESIIIEFFWIMCFAGVGFEMWDLGIMLTGIILTAIIAISQIIQIVRWLRD